MRRTCTRCGAILHRIHRSFLERFTYLALFECPDCKDISSLPRHYRYHFGRIPRCPRCGTLKIAKLKEPDRIDPFQTGFLNFLERLAGGRLYHCRYCRLQFFDRRTAHEKPEFESPEAGAAKPAE